MTGRDYCRGVVEHLVHEGSEEGNMQGRILRQLPRGAATKTGPVDRHDTEGSGEPLGKRRHLLAAAHGAERRQQQHCTAISLNFVADGNRRTTPVPVESSASIAHVVPRHLCTHKIIHDTGTSDNFLFNHGYNRPVFPDDCAASTISGTERLATIPPDAGPDRLTQLSCRL